MAKYAVWTNWIVLIIKLKTKEEGFYGAEILNGEYGGWWW